MNQTVNIIYLWMMINILHLHTQDVNQSNTDIMKNTKMLQTQP
jgi:hypothetical protein